MYTLAINVWFQKLMKQFFFGIDQVVYNAISSIYDLLISIARTSVLTQADILDMADRIYKLLAIFMIFKVTLSLITYVVNPDDFSDKNKGISKLSVNIVISLGLLILTPYIFNMAYRLQTIILEDNSLATLIFGQKKGEEDTSGNFINTAGDEMAYIAMSAFFTPNTSITEFQNCIELTGEDGKFNEKCSGLYNKDYKKTGDQTNTMASLTTDNGGTFPLNALQNYVAGVNNENFGLMFRQEMAVATVGDDSEFVMDYKYIFSTVVGVVIVLLLISFCMDVAIRSIKLAFLQLIAPIPILSYVDPKSGKDGMFKKWYQLCFKTYLSLFIRLLALYFAVYIIEKVSDMKLVDVIDGSYQTHAFIYIFVIIGALMFAKDLPKILEGLGIKLDGGGKFTLNPLKKFEESAAGGKAVTGAVGGMIAGIPRGNLLSGALRGGFANKGFKGGFAKQADVNRKIGEARMNGAGFWGSRMAGVASAFGMENADFEEKVRKLNKNKHDIELAERGLDAKTQAKENAKKRIQDGIKPRQTMVENKKKVSSGGKGLVDFSKSEITGGKAGLVSTKSQYLSNVKDYLENNQNKVADNDVSYYAINRETGRVELKQIKKGETITTTHATEASQAIGFYENKQGALEHLEVRLKGKEGYKPKTFRDENGVEDFERDGSGNIIFEKMTEPEKQKYETEHADFAARYETYSKIAEANGEKTQKSAKEIKVQSDVLASDAEMIEASYAQELKEISDIDSEISEIRNKEEIVFEGQKITIAEAKRIISEREKEINDIRNIRKTNVDAANNRKIGGS